MKGDDRRQPGRFAKALGEALESEAKGLGRRELAERPPRPAGQSLVRGDDFPRGRTADVKVGSIDRRPGIIIACVPDKREVVAD
jgi:hypothetical protein